MKTKQRPGRANTAPAFLKTLLTLIALVVIVVAAVFFAGLMILSSYDKPTGAFGPEATMFSVGQGEPGISVARRLATGRIIRSEYLFRFLMKARGLEQSLKAGDYAIPSDMGSNDILDMIARGRQRLIRFTVPEGSSLQSVASAAESAGVATARDVIEAARDPELVQSLGIAADSLVGYLFPDTYLLPRGAGGRQLVSIMVTTFKKRLVRELPETEALSPSELHERVILASIVEREYQLPEEAPLMASAFLNRLKIGMALQSCATIVYIIVEKQDKPHPYRLFDRDLQIQDPFNTYLHPGLPPEPICNPGLISLAAVVRPASTNYLYFRLIDEASGKHYFSTSLDEHIKAASLAVKPRSR